MKKSKFILLTFTLMVLLSFSLFFIPVGVKAAGDNWYTPDLEKYTFNIPAESEDFIFVRHDFETGNFVDFTSKLSDFGVSQTSTGALDFTNFQFTIFEAAFHSLMGGTYGVIPMINDSLPSYVSYTIYNTLDQSEYKGAIDRHVISYRLDFFGNYSMLLNDYIYDIVYSLEVIYELNIDYFDEIDSVLFESGYTIHWYDTTEMEEYKLYIEMNAYNELQFQLINIAESNGWNAGYGEGYDEGYNEGHEVGYDLGYNEGHDDGYSEGYDVGFEIAQPKMDILLITLIMFILSIFVYFKFRLRWVLIATILLWFVPIFLVENLFIKIFSVIMIIATITITFFSEREEEF